MKRLTWVAILHIFSASVNYSQIHVVIFDNNVYIHIYCSYIITSNNFNAYFSSQKENDGVVMVNFYVHYLNCTPSDNKKADIDMVVGNLSFC